MTISKILNSSHPTLKDDDLISTAIQLLLDHDHSTLPVIDYNGLYLGIFSMQRLLSLLLPKAALIEGGVSDLAFVSDPMRILCEKMHEQGKRTIHEVLIKDAPVVHIDTPLLEVVLLLYRHEHDIPVVDKNNGRFLGMVTSANLISQICDGN